MFASTSRRISLRAAFVRASFGFLALLALARSSVAQAGGGANSLICTGNPTTYCTPGTSVHGCVPSISGNGIPSATDASGFDIVVSQLDGQRPGTIFYGFYPTAVPWAPASPSYRCVSLPVQRTGALNSGGTSGLCDGELKLDFNSWLQANPNALGSPFVAGQTFYTQGWFRDPAAPKGTNLSDALTFSLCPGSGAFPMYIASCNLGCTSGIGGNEVSCGLISIAQNQDIGIGFSEPVDALSLSANSFSILDTTTGAVVPGARFVDPNDPFRAVFRPALTFDAQGLPVFAFQAGASYQIRLPGVAQGDPGPFVQSTTAHSNGARMLCTVIADQGIVDPVPGAPHVAIFVYVVGAPTPVDIDSGNVVDVDSQSPITFVYDDLMNMSALVDPSTGQSPFVTVEVDVDGNLNTVADRIDVSGSFAFSIDQLNLKTTVVFTPSVGYPSAGSGAQPRRIVVTIPSVVTDLVGHPLADAGTRSFVPEVIAFSPVTLPPGGEQFADTHNMDGARSGADWGESVAGRLQAGKGGGSGRLGDLVLPPGQSRTLYTSPQKASARIHFMRNVKPAVDQPQLMFDNGLLVRLKAVVTDPSSEVAAGKFLADTLSQLVHYFESNPAADPAIAQLEFSLEDGDPDVDGYDTLVVTHTVAGTAPNDSFIVAVYSYSLVFDIVGGTLQTTLHPDDFAWPPANVPYFRATLQGGVTNGLGDANAQSQFPPQALATLLDKRNFLTNLPLGAPIPDATLSAGMAEFARIALSSNSVLRLDGGEPARLFARGAFTLASTARLDASGGDARAHSSDSPLGEPTSLPGPAGGRGGRGADRPDDSNSASLLALPNCTLGTTCGSLVGCNPMSGTEVTSNAGVSNPGAAIDGESGEGVGGPLGFGGTTALGIGHGGVHWPASFPVGIALAQMAALDVAAATCSSQQLGGAGSGGAFSTDGGSGVAHSLAPTGVLGTSNTPADTLGGSASSVGLEPPSQPGPKRKLKPSLGYLRGGAGGGGGGTHPFDTQTVSSSGSCFGPTSTIATYRTHSGAAGGGGGGALQLVAGRRARIEGAIDLSGGDGGDALAPADQPCAGRVAMPGGGGAGGGLLLQSNEVELAPLPNRLIVRGGQGGSGPSLGLANPSAGGDGGAGLVRVEDNAGLDAVTAAASVAPIDPNDPSSSAWLSVDAWPRQAAPIEAYSGAESCWMLAPAGAFSLVFQADAPNAPGWDMDVWLDQGAGGVNLVSYRTSTVFGGNSPEQHWGNLIDDGTLIPPQSGAPIIVRFQGARRAGPLADPCDVDTDDSAQIEPQSLTPWVSHPSELNAFQPAPNLLRFQIVFDRSHAEFGAIQGVTHFVVRATPD